MEDKPSNFTELERKAHEIFNSSILFSSSDAAPVFSDELPRVIEVTENNQRGQIIQNIHGHAKSRQNPNASIKYSILTGSLGSAPELSLSLL